MFEAQKEINRVLYVWRGEYDAFKERQSRRRRMATNVVKMETNEAGSWPSLPEKTDSKSVVGKNPFSALEGLDVETSVVPIMAPKKATLKGWSRMASKPASKPETKPAPKPATVFHSAGSTSSTLIIVQFTGRQWHGVPWVLAMNWPWKLFVE